MSTEGWDTDPGVIRAQEIQEEARRMDQFKNSILDELRRAICCIGIVDEKDGHCLIRRDSVLDVIDFRRLKR